MVCFYFGIGYQGVYSAALSFVIIFAPRQNVHSRTSEIDGWLPRFPGRSPAPKHLGQCTFSSSGFLFVLFFI